MVRGKVQIERNDMVKIEIGQMVAIIYPMLKERGYPTIFDEDMCYELVTYGDIEFTSLETFKIIVTDYIDRIYSKQLKWRRLFDA